MQLTVTFITDFICPWCYLGKHRLRRVQEALQGEIDLIVDIKPYLLYPAIPTGGVDKSIFAKKTKPGMGSALKAAAQNEGIQLNYRKIDRIPSSREAHRLCWLIDDIDLRFTFSERIMHDYFEEGQDIEEHDYLADTASALGIDRRTIGRFLDPDQGASEVDAYIANLKSKGHTIVPMLVFADTIHLPSLQPMDVWVNYCRRAARMTSK